MAMAPWYCVCAGLVGRTWKRRARARWSIAGKVPPVDLFPLVGRVLCDIMAARVVIVPLFSDNYAYLLIDVVSRLAAAVDPAEPLKIAAALEAENVKLDSILTTHSHADHAGGNVEMARLYPGIKVYGGRGDGADGVTEEVWDGSVVKVGSLEVHVIATPCHTPGHVSYSVPGGPSSTGCVFTGDTLFIAGCGNFNSGTPAFMHDAFSKLGALPRSTLVYAGHEYTISNLQFASLVEPDNKAIAKKLEWAQSQRVQGLFTD